MPAFLHPGTMTGIKEKHPTWPRQVPARKDRVGAYHTPGAALGGGGEPRRRPARDRPVPALTEAVRGGYGDQRPRRSREEMRAPGGAALDMPPRRRRERTRGLSPVPVLNETVRPSLGRRSTPPPSGRSPDPAGTGSRHPPGAARIPVAEPVRFRPAQSDRPGGGAGGGKDEPREVGGRTDPAFPSGRHPDQPVRK